MNRLLAIDTSSEACSVALADGSGILERHTHVPLRHAELLLATVTGLLAEADLKLGSLDAIAFGCGPGSFTSLRIGIGAVQGLAWGAELPVVPVSSLAAIAWQAMDGGAPEALVAMDARMNEVFVARFRWDRGAPGLVGRESVMPPGEVSGGEARETVGCGNGFERFPVLRALGERLSSVRPDLVPRAAALVPLARSWLATHEPLPAHEAQPVYVRDHVAEKPAPAP